MCDDDFQRLLEKRVPVARCRATCLENFATSYVKFNYHGLNNMGCTTKANWKCNMCWDYCESLAVYAKTRFQMCSDDICLEGCKQACKFHNTHQNQSIERASQLSFKSSTNKLSWHHHHFSKKTIYLILTLNKETNSWIEFSQTAGTKITIPSVFKYQRITLVAVRREGLLRQVDQKLPFKLRHKRSIDSRTNYLRWDYWIAAAAFCLVLVIVIIVYVCLQITFRTPVINVAAGVSNV